jgi:hypothetical protein
MVLLQFFAILLFTLGSRLYLDLVVQENLMPSAFNPMPSASRLIGVDLTIRIWHYDWMVIFFQLTNKLVV